MSEQPTCPKCGQYDFECQCELYKYVSRALKKEVDELKESNKTLNDLCASHEARILSDFSKIENLREVLEKEMAVVDFYGDQNNYLYNPKIIYKGTKWCCIGGEQGETARTRIAERNEL